MLSQDWVLLDTETNGIVAPVAAVELAAQRMRGWMPVGEPFRALLNQNLEIPPAVSRLNGYTREILERDGEPPGDVYRAFASYVSERPLVSYNLEFDFDQVLVPEWRRFAVDPGKRGFCLLRLAQRLLDPVPAGNCKLQTLRQYYRLPERAAHTAMGDVLTAIDLLQSVLKPVAEDRGLRTWEEIKGFSEEEWFPARLAFGKFKGRLFTDATWDKELRGWLQWLMDSPNKRSAKMGLWYIEQLEKRQAAESYGPFVSPDAAVAGSSQITDAGGLAIFRDLEAEQLQALIERSRLRLAELQAEYTTERRNVDAVKAALFRLLRTHYQRRDQIKLVVDYRRRFLDSLLQSGDDEAAEVEKQYGSARTESDQEYEEAARHVDSKVELSSDEQSELKQIFKKLVKLYHPDVYHNDPVKQAIYEKLMAAINSARDAGSISVLREIAADPEAYIARQGWGRIEIPREETIQELRALYASLEAQIIEQIEALVLVKESPEYQLMLQCRERPTLLEETAERQKLALSAEIERLEAEAKRLAEQIRELTGAESKI